MSEPAPVVYLIHGDDEFAIAQFVAGLPPSILGDPSLATMNLTRQDGRTHTPDDLLQVVGSMPFLASHRLVILEYPTARITGKDAQEKFLSILKKVPPTSVLALVEYRNLTEKKERDKNRLHWLEEWAFAAGERVRIKRFDMPQMKDMAQWIQARAKTQGGVFTRPAAVELAELVGTEPRLADQEIIKLLTYVNYRRPVEREDVHHLTADTREGDIFILVDALGNRNTKAAMAMLQRLLDQDEPLNIFAMIVRQFRLLMQAREILDRNGVAVDVARELRLHPYVADKIGAQSRRFSTSVLELIYHRMLEIDRMIKSSQMPADLGLETFVAALGGIHPIDADPEMVW
jgi:DNA polymerase-3 subunit delta